jgi:threonine dehydratase
MRISFANVALEAMSSDVVYGMAKVTPVTKMIELSKLMDHEIFLKREDL